MSLSGTISGSFTGVSTSNARPKINWTATQSIAGNYSDITATLVYYRYGSYYAYNASVPVALAINGDSNTGNYGFDLRGTAPLSDTIRSRTVRVYHNADGTKSCNISFSSDTDTSFGVGSASATITLDTIPRASVVTSSLAHTIGGNLAYTLTNLGGFYVKLVLLVWNGTEYVEVISSERGTGTSGEIELGATENNIMYEAMPNVTSRAGILRAYTYSDSGYTTQVGSYQDKAGTISINQTTNKPTFTTFTVSNLDKSIANTDKYSNVLVTSSTSTLLGADTKMIKNYSKLRAVITSANKMVALNYATAIKYRFIVGSAYKEENYSADSTVNLDVDNATTNSVSVTAYDSRSLTTLVADASSITNNANYVPVSLWGLTLTRDNSVDSETKLAISGSYWKEYFGGGTDGVQNTITAHYRYKETTASWGAQSWNAITLTDTAGALSYSDYIEGDLGASGFDTEKSFDIEVRIYDKLTNTIVENSLPVGIPVLDIASGGVGIGQKFDTGVNASLQVADAIAIDAIDIASGWFSAQETWEYVSVDDPTGIFRVQADVTTKYSAGMRIKMTNGGNVIYGIITVVGGYSGGYTNITFLHQIDPADNLALYLLANSAITLPYYSTQKAPVGFPASPLSWSIISTPSNFEQLNATSGQCYETANITLPIGVWDFSYRGAAIHARTSGGTIKAYLGVALSQTSASLTAFQSQAFWEYFRTPATTTYVYTFYQGIAGRTYINLTAKDIFYLNMTDTHDDGATIQMNSIRFEAICGYL